MPPRPARGPPEKRWRCRAAAFRGSATPSPAQPRPAGRDAAFCRPAPEPGLFFAAAVPDADAQAAGMSKGGQNPRPAAVAAATAAGPCRRTPPGAAAALHCRRPCRRRRRRDPIAMTRRRPGGACGRSRLAHVIACARLESTGACAPARPVKKWAAGEGAAQPGGGPAAARARGRAARRAAPQPPGQERAGAASPGCTCQRARARRLRPDERPFGPPAALPSRPARDRSGAGAPALHGGRGCAVPPWPQIPRRKAFLPAGCGKQCDSNVSYRASGGRAWDGDESS